jgi:hypothetical protein
LALWKTFLRGSALNTCHGEKALYKYCIVLYEIVSSRRGGGLMAYACKRGWGFLMVEARWTCWRGPFEKLKYAPGMSRRATPWAFTVTQNSDQTNEGSKCRVSVVYSTNVKLTLK